MILLLRDEGIEVYSPKETIREAARLEFINKPELLIKAINARNKSVHGYYSMTEEGFIKLIKCFEKEI